MKTLYIFTISLIAISILLLLAISLSLSPPLPHKKFNYFIAANYYNSESSLQYSLPELQKVISALNLGNNIFISFLENGSTDNTKSLLSDFQLSLKVPNKIILCNQTSTSSWKLNKIFEESYLKKIFKQRSALRYLKMSVLRNEVLAPLLTYSFPNDFETKVIFLNDIFYTSDQILELISTNSGEYDMTCALDFYYEFYDILVARDINGYWFSGNYPFTSHKESQLKLKKNLPFQVKSCWNGVVVFSAKALTDFSISFRGRKYDEKICECVQSECLLFPYDFLKSGLSSIWINPRVRVSYEWKYFMLHRWIPWAVNWVQSWNFKLNESSKDLGIGCDMPPYWDNHKVDYMQVQNETCSRNASEFQVFNENLQWFDYEKTFYSTYYQEFKNSCR